MDRPKVIYIMGCGRSGTTILDMIIGNHSGFLSVGEMNAFKQAWQERRICSCGRRVTNCAIWHKIGNTFFNSKDQCDYDKMYTFQTAFERQRFIWKQVIDLYEDQKIKDYHSYVYKIFSALQELSSNKAVIDSSKSVGRAIALLRNEKIDVQILHLVRDPRGLYHSYQKRGVITPIKKLRSVALYWNITNLLGELTKIYYGSEHVIRIRYEDLTSYPNKTIDRIQGFLKEDLEDVKTKIGNGAPIERGHIASGNRIRTQDSSLTLKPDFAWKTQVSAFHQIILSMLCFPLMLTYGYLKK